MIRKFRDEDTVKVMTIWTKGNFQAHSFIDKDYWLLNFNKVKDEYLGALFVKQEYKRQGIGRKLLNYVKERYDKLELNVYEKNMDAILFYVSQGFVNQKIQIDEKTNEKEYVMDWKKD